MELIEGVNAKVCKGCNELKEFKEFNKHKKGKYGLQSRCKKCIKEYYKNNKDKILEQAKEYRENNKDKILEQAKEYRENNKEYFKEYQKEWRENNKEYFKEYKKEYYENNKGYFYTSIHKRRTNKKNNGGSYTIEQWNESLQYFNCKCAYSGKPMKNISVEHIIPITKGGTSYIWNIIPCELSLNKSKGNKDLLEWYKEQEFYSEERLNKIYDYIEYMENKYNMEEII